MPRNLGVDIIAAVLEAAHQEPSSQQHCERKENSEDHHCGVLTCVNINERRGDGGGAEDTFRQRDAVVFWHGQDVKHGHDILVVLAARKAAHVRTVETPLHAVAV